MLIMDGRIMIPDDAITLTAVRSGGPGGQNVNKVSTKVELRLLIDRIIGLDEAARLRLIDLAGNRLTLDGVLIITSERSRQQLANREDVMAKMIDLIERSLIPPKPRRPTRATRASKERRLAGKKEISSKKRNRGSIQDD